MRAYWQQHAHFNKCVKSAAAVNGMDTEPQKPIDLLLVDDDADFRSSVARRFMRRGYQVQEAASGEEALQLAEAPSIRRGRARHGDAGHVRPGAA